MPFSIIIPVYNGGKYIENTIGQILTAFDNEANIICVNDGSLDDTLLVLNKYANRIKIITYNKNQGKGFALKKGFEEAEDDLILFTDADLPYGTENIRGIVEKLKEGVDEIVIGYREKFNEKGFRWLTHHTLTLGTNILFWIKLKDTQCGLKGFKKDFIKKIIPILKSNNFTIDLEILYLAKLNGKNISKVLVEANERETTTISFWDIIIMGLELLKIRLTKYPKI